MDPNAFKDHSVLKDRSTRTTGDPKAWVGHQHSGEHSWTLRQRSSEIAALFTRASLSDSSSILPSGISEAWIKVRNPNIPHCKSPEGVNHVQSDHPAKLHWLLQRHLQEIEFILA